MKMSGEVRTYFRRIVHPTDFTEASARAFFHTLRLALSNQSWMGLVHVKESGESVHWADFPGVRETLVEWGVLPEGAERSRVGELGLSVRKDILKGNTVRAISSYAHREGADTIVLSTHARGVFSQLFQESVAERVARQGDVPTLFLPHGSEGFVEPETGDVRLARILVPVACQPSPALAIEAVSQLVGSLCCEDVTFRLLFIGEEEDRPHIREPEGPGWHWEHHSKTGALVPSIVESVKEWEADLVVMATAGHDSLKDSVFGSSTEQVLHECGCPLLAVPS